MAEFTREQLISRARIMIRKHREMLAINPDYDGIARDVELFEIALAALTAEPEAYVVGSYSLLHYQSPKLDEYIGKSTPLYRLPLLEGLK